MSTDTSAPPLEDWLAAYDYTMATRAAEAVDQEDALRDGAAGAVEKSQLRATLNTAGMCATIRELRTFIRSRAERRAKAGKKDKAAFWNALLTQLRIAQDDFVAPALTACASEDPDAATIRIVRTYFEHLIAHCQLISSQSR